MGIAGMVGRRVRRLKAVIGMWRMGGHYDFAFATIGAVANFMVNRRSLR
jgi:hypothetical protein